MSACGDPLGDGVAAPVDLSRDRGDAVVCSGGLAGGKDHARAALLDHSDELTDGTEERVGIGILVEGCDHRSIKHGRFIIVAGRGLVDGGGEEGALCAEGELDGGDRDLGGGGDRPERRSAVAGLRELLDRSLDDASPGRSSLRIPCGRAIRTPTFDLIDYGKSIANL